MGGISATHPSLYVTFNHAISSAFAASLDLADPSQLAVSRYDLNLFLCPSIVFNPNGKYARHPGPLPGLASTNLISLPPGKSTSNRKADRRDIHDEAMETLSSSGIAGGVAAIWGGCEKHKNEIGNISKNETSWGSR